MSSGVARDQAALLANLPAIARDGAAARWPPPSWW
jgi:hypothetical protein